MGGKMSAEYWRAYRKKNKERVTSNERARRAVSRVRNRINEYAKAKEKRIQEALLRDNTKLPPLFPHLQMGGSLAFWQDELAMDMEQEKALALLEGRDPDEAAKEYKKREISYLYHIAPLLIDGDFDEE